MNHKTLIDRNLFAGCV